MRKPRRALVDFHTQKEISLLQKETHLMLKEKKRLLVVYVATQKVSRLQPMEQPLM
jgi:hypothetical protein